MPRVSVLVPSYRHARFLDQCLQSVASQTFQDWEAVIVDDCSEDGSLEAAQAWAGRDSRFRVFSNDQNRGAYPTQARAASLAESGLVAVLNSDDLWLPDKLAAQVELLDSDPGVAACATLGWPCDEHGLPDESTDLHADWPVGDLPAAPWLLYENRVLASSVVFRRSGFRPFTELRYSGDWSLLLAASSHGRLHVLPDRAVLWRQHGENSYTVSPSQVAEEIAWRRSLPMVAARLGLSGDEARRGLGRNAINLFALEVLAGRTLRAAAVLGPMLATPEWRRGLKRWASLLLGTSRCRRRLWRGQPRALEAVSPGSVGQVRLDAAAWLDEVTSGSG